MLIAVASRLPTSRTRASRGFAADTTEGYEKPVRTLLQTALFSFTSSRTSEVFITRFANLRISLTARGACFLTAARGDGVKSR